MARGKTIALDRKAFDQSNRRRNQSPPQDFQIGKPEWRIRDEQISGQNCIFICAEGVIDGIDAIFKNNVRNVEISQGQPL